MVEQAEDRGANRPCFPLRFTWFNECDARLRRLSVDDVRVEDRDAYLSAVDHTSIDLNIGSFAGFIAERVRWSMEQTGNFHKRAGP
jgi:hypothetical protein